MVRKQLNRAHKKDGSTKHQLTKQPRQPYKNNILTKSQLKKNIDSKQTNHTSLHQFINIATSSSEEKHQKKNLNKVIKIMNEIHQ